MFKSLFFSSPFDPGELGAFLDFNKSSVSFSHTALRSSDLVNADWRDQSVFNQTSSFTLNQMFVYVFLASMHGKVPQLPALRGRSL